MTSALKTDYYQLKMAQGFWQCNVNKKVVFEMFFRVLPFDAGFCVFAGLDDVIDSLEDFSFTSDDIDFLRQTGEFCEDFLKYLSTFKFTGDVYAFNEGEAVFPLEPLIRIHADIIEAQIIETFLLSTINFETLIATKASRYRLATEKPIMEFGARRAHGFGAATLASRASFIGGCSSTSNVEAAKLYGIKPVGTMSHSWVMLFRNDEEAFRKFAQIYPNNPVFLIDTYSTLQSGVKAAVKVGKELQKKGIGFGIRIDSGDLSYLTKEVRKVFDKEGLKEAKITVSNDLTESIIESLEKDGAPIDSYGVGTKLVTGSYASSLGGVYKLSCILNDDNKKTNTAKFSNTLEKASLPGVNEVYRFFDKDGIAIGDLVAMQSEKYEVGKKYIMKHPFEMDSFYTMEGHKEIKSMILPQMKNGKRINKKRTLLEIRENAKKSISSLHKTTLRLKNPHLYKVSYSQELINERTKLKNSIN